MKARLAGRAAVDASVAAADTCFHCGEPIRPAARFSVRFEGVERAVCCRGCEAAAGAILDWGLERFYRMRRGGSPRPPEQSAADLERLRVFDDPLLQRRFAGETAGERRASLILERIACPACCWLIERCLAGTPGVSEAHVDYTTARARISWDAGSVRLSDILRAVAKLGYEARPYDAAVAEISLIREGRTQLRRLALAGLFGMQVMMISVALYFGAWSGIEDSYRRFLQWTALLLTLPVIGYAALPFFRNAWREVRAFRPGMDLPVALGLGIAFAGSMYATVTGTGQVYYDSVSMFVFLLLGGRYLEFSVRRRIAGPLDRLHQIAPGIATRLDPLADGGWGERVVPAITLRPGNRILVRPGESFPADGVAVQGETSVDESLLSGESRPVRRRAGDRVIGGSANVESPIHVQVERVGEDTVLAVIGRLAERCGAEKPALTEVANHAAAWFVAGVLALSAGAAWYWLRVDPEMWLPVTISMLVITCPCALALAAPTALAAATGTLLRNGLLVVRANAVETLARATLFVFDKTGTLTMGRPVLRDVRARGETEPAECLRIAAALETGSAHPLADAVRRVAKPSPVAGTPRHIPGEGVAGEVGGRICFFGNAAFIRRMSRASLPDVVTPGAVLLATESALLAEFEFEDQLRGGAADLLAWLRQAGRHTAILSGDDARIVGDLGRRLGAGEAMGGKRPLDKVNALNAFERAGHTVCMVGDGVNDAPVLAAAHISVAMGHGADLAKASADLILLDGRFESLRGGIELAVRTLAVIRANVHWAVAYNILALPLAASGWVPPWLAALGMSASSLLVTANSARLLRSTRA